MDEFIGIVKLFAGNFAPRGWAMCNGQLLPISQYSAVFAILGTSYGGDGVSTFGLPDFRSRVAIGAGQGQGLTSYQPGQRGGNEAVTIHDGNMPPHNHSAQLAVSNANSAVGTPTAGVSIAAPGAMSGRDFAATLGYVAGDPNTVLNGKSVTTGMAGGGMPLPILDPYMAMNYIICLEGIFPPRP